MPHLTLDQNLWAVLGGLFSGALMTVVGGGASALAVPLLTTLVGLRRVHLAMGTTAVSVAVTAVISAVMHARRGQVSWRAALLFVGPGLIGIWVGSGLQRDFSTPFLMTALALVLLGNAALMVGMPNVPKRLKGESTRGLVRLAPLGGLVGLLAGMLGGGGGFLALPSMMLGGLSLSTAVGSSVVSMGSLGAVSALSFAIRGLVDWRVVVEYSVGGLFGASLATPLAERLSRQQRRVTLLVSVLLMMVSLYLMANNVPRLYRPGPVI